MKKGTGAALPAEHERAWRSYLRVNALLLRALDADLRREHGMSLVTYDALVQLSEATEQRLYMKDLADALVYSASGLTRLVDGLEKAGYVRREADPANRRATLVALTVEGRDALDSAWPTHARGVRELFVDHVTPAQAVVLGDVFGSIRAGLED